MIFRWIFIPWLQHELDAYRERVNNTAKRADRNKVLPHGVPNHIFEHPEEYGALDFKVSAIYLHDINVAYCYIDQC
jgi:hypothetical protein